MNPQCIGPEHNAIGRAFEAAMCLHRGGNNHETTIFARVTRVARGRRAARAASAGAHGKNRPEIFRAWLAGFEEVGPNIAAVSSPAHGFLRAIVDEDEGTIQYWLTFDGFVNTVAQSHFHFGQHHTAGGISVFLCTNLGNARSESRCRRARSRDRSPARSTPRRDRSGGSGNRGG